MEELSHIGQTIHKSCRIDVPAYFHDHHVEGRTVLPAVEAMHALAESLRQQMPAASLAHMNAIHFDKFLYLSPQESRVDAFVDIDTDADGNIHARFLTKSKAGKSPITRVKEHAAFTCERSCRPPQLHPLDMHAALEGSCFEVSPDRIYNELVPFGPSYRNLKTLFVSAKGALARIDTPSIAPPSHSSALLGSPFLLDAAFHAACVWGQRYCKTVAFPVGIDRRQIHVVSQAGKTYFCKVLPVKADGAELIFDFYLCDAGGKPVESLSGVHMRDVSGGRVEPPSWINATETVSWAHFELHCLALALIENKTVMPFAETTLSVREKERYRKMGDKRRGSYLAARLALKRLARKLSNDDRMTPADEITTVAKDMQRPVCRSTDKTSSFNCSVSHDDRFTIAVASDTPVGVDVEKQSSRVLEPKNLYLSSTEQVLVRQSEPNEIAAAVRIWSIKEAVAKACRMNLADAWSRVEVIDIGDQESALAIDGNTGGRAAHLEIDAHVFTLYTLNGRT